MFLLPDVQSYKGMFDYLYIVFTYPAIAYENLRLEVCIHLQFDVFTVCDGRLDFVNAC